jgi:hypothetical protein
MKNFIYRNILLLAMLLTLSSCIDDPEHGIPRDPGADQDPVMFVFTERATDPVYREFFSRTFNFGWASIDFDYGVPVLLADETSLSLRGNIPLPEPRRLQPHPLLTRQWGVVPGPGPYISLGVWNLATEAEDRPTKLWAVYDRDGPPLALARMYCEGHDSSGGCIPWVQAVFQGIVRCEHLVSGDPVPTADCLRRVPAMLWTILDCDGNLPAVLPNDDCDEDGPDWILSDAFADDVDNSSSIQ